MKKPAMFVTGVIAAVVSVGEVPKALGQTTRVWTDAAGDAMLRRTDLGNAGVPLAGADLPDLISVTLGGWMPSNPMVSQYVGSFVPAAGADILRMDVVVNGLVVPPGPIDPLPELYNPTLYGTSPFFAYIEVDIDNDADTGGEREAAGNMQYLAQAARFGARPQRLRERAITTTIDAQSPCDVEPFFRRTSGEFAMSFCGCGDTTLVTETGNMNGVMEAGETFVMSGRFFPRTPGYSRASLAFGSGFPGEYTPLVQAQFAHTPGAGNGTTTVSLVFPLTMHGYAILNGLPSDPPANRNVADAFSVFEAFRDVILFCNSQPIPFCEIPIAAGWCGRDASNYLDVTTWNVMALVGTTYNAPTGVPFIWTDIGFDAVHMDMDGDGLVNQADRDAILAYIDLHDGDGVEDADAVRDGTVTVAWFAFYYSIYDINYDGLVNQTDVDLVPGGCTADWDNMGGVNTADFFAFLSDFFAVAADYNNDGTTNTDDFFGFISDFFAGCD